jgi:hypothetical protein
MIVTKIANVTTAMTGATLATAASMNITHPASSRINQGGEPVGLGGVASGRRVTDAEA